MIGHFVIAGCGYTGQRLAAALAGRGRVTAIARSAGSLAALPSTVERVQGELGAVRVTMTDDTAIVYLAPPPARGDRDTTLEAFLARLVATRPARIVYASTSGVYGDCGGQRVTEQRPPMPQTGRAIRRLAAENALREWCGANAVGLVILRVAGIYGPGRLPLERIRRREPMLRAEDAGPGNRIHVDDLVSVCGQAASIESPPPLVNVCDGDHLSSTAFTKLVADIAGLAAPPEIPLTEARERFTPMRWSFLAESRRLDNTIMREALGVDLRYADPRDGIRASMS